MTAMTGQERIEAAAARAARLRLAPCEPRHAGALFALLDDWEVVRMLAVVPWPPCEADMRRLMSARLPGLDNFVIALGDEPIGVATVKQPGSGDPPRRMPRLGYWIGRRYWGRGLGTEAIRLLAGHAFGAYPAEVIGAGVFTDNPASRRVLEKLGFRRVGGFSLHCVSRAAEVMTDDMNLARAAWETSGQGGGAR